MIQIRTILNLADNSGAKRLRVISLKGGSKRYVSGLADVVKAVVDGAIPNGAVKDSEVIDALVVRVKKETGREDGTYVRFDDNAAVIIDKDGNPRGTRIFGPIAREVREKGYAKIVSLAQEVI